MEVYESKSGFKLKSNTASETIRVEEYDALFIPGGFSPDFMRRTKATVDLVKAFDEANKPIAAICHGPWMLASANAIRGKEVTSVNSIKDDLINAGASWVDQELVVSENILTARNPRDLPVLLKKFTSMI